MHVVGSPLGQDWVVNCGRINSYENDFMILEVLVVQLNFISNHLKHFIPCDGVLHVIGFVSMLSTEFSAPSAHVIEIYVV